MMIFIHATDETSRPIANIYIALRSLPAATYIVLVRSSASWNRSCCSAPCLGDLLVLACLTAVWSPVYTIQHVVKPVVKPVVEPGLTTGWMNSGCSFNRLSNPLYNRLYNWFNNQLYRVYSRLSNWLSNRLYNRVDNRLNEQPLFVQSVVKPGCTFVQPIWQPVWQPAVYTIQLVVKPVVQPVVQRVWQPVERTATVCSIGCQTGLYNLFDIQFDNRLYTIQPVVNPVAKWVSQPVEYLYTRYNLLSNRFDNPLYRVYKHSAVWQPVWQQVVSCKWGLRQVRRLQCTVIVVTAYAVYLPWVLWHGWVSGRASGLYKMEWWGAGVVICLDWSASDLHMVHLLPLPSHRLLFIKSQNGLPP